VALQSSGEHNRCARIFSPHESEDPKKFEEEIAELSASSITSCPRRSRARELGDLRENAEYQAAKDRQGIVNARIAMLKKRVGEISIMNLRRFRTIARRSDQRFSCAKTTAIRLLISWSCPEEADAAKGLISTSSPIGRAIVGKAEGDEIKVSTPGGTRHFEIVKLVTIHDEA
jgi:transcription elongation factor GreA